KAYNEDLSISRQNNNHEGIVRALNNLGIIMSQQGDYDDALQYYAEGIELAERMNDHKLVCILYSNIADSYKLKGSSTEAQRFYERCIELSGDLGFKWQIAESYRGLADIVPNKREHYLKQALTMFERLGASEDARSVRAMIEDG
ncbi:MAG: tetratricopeptide repeat protein, partial [Thermoplasmata archaeon]|nr:tetratricopeptide repeat protein [Thermoplasmata archaeon]